MHGPHRADKTPVSAFDPVAEMTMIKARLLLRGLTLSQIDLAYDLPLGTAGTTLREPNAAGERAIAAALGTRPELLWRRRYHASGQAEIAPITRES
jgi:Ner family transcriptional regulator